jgi:hypothetical protein
MTDYTKSTNFASKDALLSGNPLKIVKGTEIDTEFNNIATAISTKADSSSPTLTGIPIAPTAAAGTNTTQLATTAFVQAAFQVLYPVGSVYTNISDSTNPGTLFGFGTWVAITGRVIVGYDSGDATFSTAGATGGSKNAVLVSHTHTDAGHTHTYRDLGYGGGNGNFTGSSGSWSGSPSSTSNTSSSTANLSTEGVSATNANLQPYVVAYVWKRTA